MSIPINRYPYTDLHEMNMDWILAQLKAISTAFKNFDDLNLITWSGFWSATEDYRKFTIVDGGTGDLYISLDDVPAGTPLTDLTYWKQLNIDYTSQINSLNTRVTGLESHEDVACVIRKFNDGWALIDDLYHKPLHVASVTPSPDGKYLEITYDKVYSHVNSIVADPDEGYARQGLKCGCSVGLDKTKIYPYYARPFSGGCIIENGVPNYVSSAGMLGDVKQDVTVTASTITFKFGDLGAIASFNSAACALSQQLAQLPYRIYWGTGQVTYACLNPGTDLRTFASLWVTVSAFPNPSIDVNQMPADGNSNIWVYGVMNK